MTTDKRTIELDWHDLFTLVGIMHAETERLKRKVKKDPGKGFEENLASYQDLLSRLWKAFRELEEIKEGQVGGEGS